jgi:hypothetical protein
MKRDVNVLVNRDEFASSAIGRLRIVVKRSLASLKLAMKIADEKNAARRHFPLRIRYLF